MPDELSNELSLDPEDWESFRELAHRMVDTMILEAQTFRERPAWAQAPAEIQDRLSSEPLPIAGQGEAEVFDQFLSDVLPYGNGNRDPRFLGWVQGTGFPLAMLADMLAAGMNPHMAGSNQNPVLVETKVVEWFRDAMDFPMGASGLLLSGGSMANFTALAVARNARAGFDVRQQGLQESPLMTIYGSSETHSWAKKAVEVLGLGNRSYRRVAVSSDFRMDVQELRSAVNLDLAAGHRPIAVIATAGTVNTGATDDLNAIADLCAEFGLWMHVDGAFGALAAISPKLRDTVAGMERADSVAFDLHKWMYMPFEIACLLVRDGDTHRATFSQSASYIATTERGVSAGGFRFAEMGLELTRGFKALKAWMSLKAYGFSKFAALIEQNVEQAQYFASRISDEPELELIADVPLNIVCFRYRGIDLDGDQLNSVNKELLLRIQERGIAVPSSTVIGDAFCLRVCMSNHRTRRGDLDGLVEAIVAIGRELVEPLKR